MWRSRSLLRGHVEKHSPDFNDTGLLNPSGENHDNSELGLFTDGSTPSGIYWGPQWVSINSILPVYTVRKASAKRCITGFCLNNGAKGKKKRFNHVFSCLTSFIILCWLLEMWAFSVSTFFLSKNKRGCLRHTKTTVIYTQYIYI